MEIDKKDWFIPKNTNIVNNKLEAEAKRLAILKMNMPHHTLTPYRPYGFNARR